MSSPSFPPCSSFLSFCSPSLISLFRRWHPDAVPAVCLMKHGWSTEDVRMHDGGLHLLYAEEFRPLHHSSSCSIYFYLAYCSYYLSLPLPDAASHCLWLGEMTNVYAARHLHNFMTDKDLGNAQTLHLSFRHIHCRVTSLTHTLGALMVPLERSQSTDCTSRARSDIKSPHLYPDFFCGQTPSITHTCILVPTQKARAT